jgi:hypothetical protein
MKIILLSVLLYSTCAFAQPTTIEVIKNSAVDKNKPVTIRMYCGSQKPTGNPPLFILNGFVIADSVFTKLDPSQIQSIEVFKDATAIERFGTKGKNGVISITAKQELIDDLTRQGLLKPIQ